MVFLYLLRSRTRKILKTTQSIIFIQTNIIITKLLVVQLIEAIETILSLFIIFLKRFHTHKRASNVNKRFLSTAAFGVFLFAYFCFFSWFLRVCVFVRLKFVCKNRLEIVLMPQLPILLSQKLFLLPQKLASYF